VGSSDYLLGGPAVTAGGLFGGAKTADMANVPGLTMGMRLSL
jgi:hypothetical protein